MKEPGLEDDIVKTIPQAWRIPFKGPSESWSHWMKEKSARPLSKLKFLKFLDTSIVSTVNLEEALSLLDEMVKINSVSHNSVGVNKVQKIVQTYLEGLGFETRRIRNLYHSSGDLIVGLYKGQSEKKINMICHADTVLEPWTNEGLLVDESRSIAYGSGIIDNKGGVICALLGLKEFLSQNPKPKYSIQFICSPNEELGSQGFQEIFQELADDSIMALGFEPALEGGSIIESRRGNRWYRVKVKGKSAHAGRTDGSHINAAHEIAEKIVRLSKLNNSKKGLSLNVSGIDAGTRKFNVICGHGEIRIDARFQCFKSRDQLHKKILKILETSHEITVDGKTGSSSEFVLEDDCPPFSASLKSKLAVKKYRQILSRLEHQAILSDRSGGAGDINYLSQKDIIVIDGLGPRGGNMHTKEEFIEIPSLKSRIDGLSEFLFYANQIF